MHIAICIWGICRSSHLTYDSFKKQILDKLTEFGFTYDIFLHTYEINHVYTNNRAGEIGYTLNNENWKLFKPTKFIIEDDKTVDERLQLPKYRSKSDPWGSNFRDSTFDNHIRALYSLKQVTALWTPNAASYNAVMYCRPDVRYLYPLQKKWFSAELLNSCVQIPNFQKHPINDRFCIGSPSKAIYFGTRFDKAYEFSKHNELHSERYLFHTLKAHNVPIHEIDFNFKRIRVTGADGDPNIN